MIWYRPLLDFTKSSTISLTNTQRAGCSEVTNRHLSFRSLDNKGFWRCWGPDYLQRSDLFQARDFTGAKRSTQKSYPLVGRYVGGIPSSIPAAALSNRAINLDAPLKRLVGLSPAIFNACLQLILDSPNVQLIRGALDSLMNVHISLGC